MLQLGKHNCLTVIEVVADGYYVAEADNSTEKFFLSAKEVRRERVNQNKEAVAGDQLDVFCYKNADGSWVATMESPLAQVGECAFLEVLSVNDYGAFLDWGLPKDLLLPFSEQAYPVREGGRYVVYIFVDESTDRIACSTVLHEHLSEEGGGFRPRQAVDLLIAAKSDLGYKAVINGEYIGLIFHEDLSQPLQFGERMQGWIKSVRADGKIDLSINSLDKKSRDELDERILAHLKKVGGRAPLSDKSPPEEIFRIFKVSKRNFKRSVGNLYKQRLIRIESDGIELAE